VSALRLLVLAPSSPPASTLNHDPAFPALLEAFTKSRPSADVTTFSGYTSHPPLRLRTKYYAADISIWCDELPMPPAISSTDGNRLQAVDAAETKAALDPRADTTSTGPSEEDQPTSLEDWKTQMLSPEATEVRSVIGGIVLVLPFSTASSAVSDGVTDAYMPLIETVHALRETIEDENFQRDIAAVVMLQSTSAKHVPTSALDAALEKLEDRCLTEQGILGWDFVAWDGQHGNQSGEVDAKNVYGERVGISRVIEALEAIDWSAAAGGDDDDGKQDDYFDGLGDDFEQNLDAFADAAFQGLDHELQREMMELKLSMLDTASDDGFKDTDGQEDDGQDVKVEQLQNLMEKVIAVREAGSEMSRPERQRFAKREIGKIMREMG